MRYKNMTKNILRFRAYNKEGIKQEFELKPEEEMDFIREVTLGGLELIETEKIEKAGKGKSKKSKESE